jgi:membrane-anchored protein YejM (alkaline phosphatase superfamily)
MSDMQSDSSKESLSINNKMSALFTEGLHNIQGVVVAVVFIVSIYLPILDAPYAETASIMDQDVGIFLFLFLFLFLAVLLVLFYGGASKYLMRIVATICIGMTVFFYPGFIE